MNFVQNYLQIQKIRKRHQKLKNYRFRAFYQSDCKINFRPTYREMLSIILKEKIISRENSVFDHRNSEKTIYQIKIRIPLLRYNFSTQLSITFMLFQHGLAWLKKQPNYDPNLDRRPIARRLGPGLVHLLSEQEIQDDLRIIKTNSRKRSSTQTSLPNKVNSK